MRVTTGTAFFIVCGLFVGYLTATAQITIDPALRVAAIIKPSDVPGWPDSLGATVVRGGMDINGNGKKEFVVLGDPYYGPDAADDSLRPYLFWFENNGDDSYTCLWWAAVPGGNRSTPILISYADFAVADIDKDGKPEITVVFPRGRLDTPEFIAIYEFDNGTFPSQPTFISDGGLPPGYLYEVTRVAVDDIDGDNENEVVVIARRDDFGGSLAGGRTMLVLNLLGGEISPSTFSLFVPEFADSGATLKGGGVYDMGIVDFDRDGKKEIWVFTWDLFSIAIYEATGANAYALQADINRARPSNDVGARHSMSFYDTDGDGKLEMYVAGITDATNPGNIHFIGSTDDVSTLSTKSVVTLTPDLEPIDYWSYEAGAIGDLDGNGKMDYIVAGAGRKEIFRLEYLGGPVEDPLSYTMTTIYKDENPEHVDWTLQYLWMGQDLDGDGKKEIVITNKTPRVDTDDGRIIVLEAVAGTGVERVGGEVPATFSLAQNYPNPFNPSTTIRFGLPYRSHVTLTVFSALGQEVSTLVEGEQEAGSYEVKFDAIGLSSGVYFYRLTADNFVQSRKLLLVR